MKHFYSKYDPIQDPSGLVGKDEPVFLLRGTDKIAPALIHAWAEILQLLDGDEDLANEAHDWAVAMYEWQNINSRKVPD